MKYSFNEEFFSIPLYVDNRVLTPRNDTETMIYQVLKEKLDNFVLIDVWTGSGAILTAILKNTKFDLSQAFWVDISSDALEVAKINIEKHDLQDKVILDNSDLLEVFLNEKYKINSKNIIITANLPYIKNWDFANMDKEVLENEPHIALFGWEKTWFEMYERLISQIFELKELLNNSSHAREEMLGRKKGGDITLFIEIWFDQYEYSRQYLSSLGLKFEYFKDLNNIYRVIKINFN